MSIEQTLERIVVAVETLVALQKGQVGATTSPAISNTMPSPSGTGPGQPPQVQPPQVQPPQVQPPQVQPPPQVAAPAPVTSMPGPSGTGPGQTVPPAFGGPAAGDLKDQIREAANAFHRTHPERAGEVWQILANNGSTGGIDGLPPQVHANVLQQIQALGA